eukprot:COSAG01_NODE_10182_length_2227_cov_77.611372_1_plen_152_part_10
MDSSWLFDLAKTKEANSHPDPPSPSTEGDRANARDSSQPTQVFLGSPPSAGGAFGGTGGCCVEAGAELLKIPVETMRALLQVKLRAMNGDKTFLGDIQTDRYHHNVLERVVEDRGYTLVTAGWLLKFSRQHACARRRGIPASGQPRGRDDGP